MKFIVGFVTGAVVGAIGAVAYSVQSGRDLREAFEEVRTEVSNRDIDAIGKRIETAVAEMQAQFETRITAVREQAAAAVADGDVAVGDAAASAGDAIEAAGDAVGEAAEAAGEAVSDAGEAAAEKLDIEKG